MALPPGVSAELAQLCRSAARVQRLCELVGELEDFTDGPGPEELTRAGAWREFQRMASGDHDPDDEPYIWEHD